MKKNNSRLDPESRELAFVFQFEDDVRVLKSLALRDKEGFKKHLAVMQAHINAYNSIKLQKACAASEQKQKANEDFVKNPFPICNETIKSCLISRYDKSIKEPPFLTIPIDSVNMSQPDTAMDELGEIFCEKLRQACHSKGYVFKFYTTLLENGYDYEIVVL